MKMPPLLSLLAAAVVAAAPAHAAPVSDAASPPAAARGWWSLFRDPQLDALIDRAHAGNPGLSEYAARLAAARAAVRLDAASAAPALDLSAGATQAGGPLINAAGGSGSLFTARAGVSWEADLFGKTARLVRAGQLDAEAAAARLAEARLLVEADTAIAYFDLQLSIAGERRERQRLAWAEDAAAIASQSAALGLLSRLDTGAGARDLAEARLALAEAVRMHAEAWHRLGALAGDPRLPEPAAIAGLTVPPVPAGLGAEVLGRRPDLAAARAHLQAAQRRRDVVKREWLPAIALTASGGSASSSLVGLVDAASRGYGLGLLLGSPLLDGGRHRARVAGADAGVALADAEYRSATLAALRETADCLTALDAARARQVALAGALEQARADRRAIHAGVVAGLRSRSAEFAPAQRESAAEQAWQGAGADIAIATVRLVKALGGGWD